MWESNSTTIMPSGTPIRKYPFVAWRRLKPVIDWRQGMHALSVGGTGSGKSTVAGEFYPYRSQVVVCVTKGMDDIFDGPYYRDYETITKWPPGKGQRWWALGSTSASHRRVLLRPPNASTIRETSAINSAIFRKMFDDILLKRGKWCIGMDEEHYACETLKLEPEITAILEQGRSGGISIWNNTQRPANVPLATYVNSSMAFLFSSQEEYDVRRLGKMRNKHTHAKEMMANIEALDSFASHEFVFIDRSGRVPPVRSIVDARKG